ncbi:MAG: hypothetical protein QW182_01220 [Thermosphaera sp.]
MTAIQAIGGISRVQIYPLIMRMAYTITPLWAGSPSGYGAMPEATRGQTSPLQTSASTYYSSG